MNGVNDPKLHMIVYLQVAQISQALIFVTRSHGFFFMERPSFALFGAFCLAQLISSIIAAFGNWGFTDVQGISGGWIGIVWIWNIIWFFPLGELPAFEPNFPHLSPDLYRASRSHQVCCQVLDQDVQPKARYHTHIHQAFGRQRSAIDPYTISRSIYSRISVLKSRNLDQESPTKGRTQEGCHYRPHRTPPCGLSSSQGERCHAAKVRCPVKL